LVTFFLSASLVSLVLTFSFSFSLTSFFLAFSTILSDFFLDDFSSSSLSLATY
jgi:hypothetical protein